MMFVKPCPDLEPHAQHTHVHHWDKKPEEPIGWFPPGSYASMPDEGWDAEYICRGIPRRTVNCKCTLDPIPVSLTDQQKLDQMAMYALVAPATGLKSLASFRASMEAQESGKPTIYLDHDGDPHGR